ncbi:efflux RND transporter periplasmic adaptor subunit [Neorhizobium lilium]|uniref:Efflux RND transporter periplasmic adaptor subunit n=1 Tax=Neorhizobium lilium TaxID=2503024 RepID=A0A444LIB6_9HYPH|nr:efflux RND transporter periplasmic adaptor subunit [Neorhizobium lilium]RWX78768.1 efflux RND transporter periplasmic adaptor subunit [Neorhizobium lilium]
MKYSISIIALLLAATTLSGCQKQDENTAEAPRPVLSVVAAETPADTLRLPGTIQPKFETQLGFRVLGRLIARNVSVGDVVKKGDVVAAIDPLSLELAVRSSQSDLSNAQAGLRNAQSTQQRQLLLAESRSGTAAALEQAQQGLKTAIASVAKAQANLDKANEQLGYAQLHAEFDGVVTATSAEVGQIVSAGQVVVTIARPDERDAVVDVPQAAAGKLQAGAPFEVSLQLDPSIRTSGTVREIAPAADAATRTRRTKIALADPPEAFRLGSVVTVSATISAKPRIVLPASAILFRDGATSVWIVDAAARKVIIRPVSVADPVVPGGVVTIADGVHPGDRVVVAGVNKLKDGQAIKIDQEINQ